MRSIHWFLPLLAWAPLVHAQVSGLNSTIVGLPECAQSCFAIAVKESSCTPTVTGCICTDQQLQSNMQVCVTQTCTRREALTTKNITSTLCHEPKRNAGNSIRVLNAVLAAMTAMFAVPRLIYRAVYATEELGWDDYSVVVTLFAGLPSVIIIDRGLVYNGLGADVWTVPFDQITNFLRYLYAAEILYFSQIPLLKMTLLLFFLRIFPKPIIRRLLWGTVAFNLICGLAFVLATIFQCQRISYYWTSWDKNQPGKCININAIVWSNAIISIVLDVWMLALPLHEVLQLQLSWRKKVSVTVMFCVGTFVTVVSVLRLRSLVHFAASSNPTWDQADVVYWSTIEINVGILCASLPALRVILVKIFPAIMGPRKPTVCSHYRYSGRPGRSQGGMKIGGSVVVSGLDHWSHMSLEEPHSNTCTKTFQMQHGDNDEASLVQMHEFPKKAKTPSRSSSTSMTSL